ncbi:MAG: thioredoxin family protein [Phycisphaeraceae bacterium]|nr:MAG: thioredoxin family protein [Phycisphaeraceae bacterium]
MHVLKIRKPFAALAACFITAVAAGQMDQPMHGHRAEGVKVGEKAPDFTLADLNGQEHKLSDLTSQGKVVVLEWFNPGCPFVKHHYAPKFNTMNALADKYRDQNVAWLRINSGAPGKQGAGLETNKAAAAEWKIKDPILLDESGKVGHAYGSRNTPTMVVIDSTGTIAYFGAIDNDPRGDSDDHVNYVDKALTEVLAGETVTTAQTKPYGCGVKY